MGDGRDGDVGRDDGLRDADMLEHSPHTNGQARSCRKQLQGETRLLPHGRRVKHPAQDQHNLRKGLARQLRRTVRLGRENTGTSAVGVLLRLHNNAFTRGCFIAKNRW